MNNARIVPVTFTYGVVNEGLVLCVCADAAHAGH